MSIARKHIQSLTDERPSGFELPWWRPSGILEDNVLCAHCGSWMDEYPDPDCWELSFEDFADVHNRSMRESPHLGSYQSPNAQLHGAIYERKTCVYVCQRCGWWVAEDRAVLPSMKSQIWVVTLASYAVLQELDQTDISTPIEEARRYLMRKYNAIHTLNPRLLELLVASVLRDFGFRAFATAYTNDGGVDVVLHDSANICVGVQVKRQKRSIEVEQIRAFLGALTLGNYAAGVFISTSRFRKGAILAADMCTQRHIPISLVNADRFFDMLGYAQLVNGARFEDCGISRSKPLSFYQHSHYYLNTL